MADPLHELRAHLYEFPVGPHPDTGVLESLLEQAWDQFDGSQDQGMSARKLVGRIYDLQWDPPILSFEIDRHGGTVLGSSRAERQHWKLDIDTQQATCVRAGFRQLHPASPRLDVDALAREIADMIRAAVVADRLNWLEDGRVRVSVGKIIPDHGPKATLAGRRKRFRKALSVVLAERGWDEVGRYTFRRRV